MAFKYQFGGIKIEGDNINELREFSEELGELAKEAGADLSKHLNDACFAIDADYQRHHGLHQDNWDVVHNLPNVYYQPEFKDGNPPISKSGNEPYSFEVYKSRDKCQEEFPDCQIITYSGDDIEDPTFVDE